MLSKATMHGRRLIHMKDGLNWDNAQPLSSVGVIYFVALPTFKGQQLLSVIPVIACALEFEYPMDYPSHGRGS